MADGDLVSERKAPRVLGLVKRAAAKAFGPRKARPFYEDGHWWVVVFDTDRKRDVVYDVVDSEPGMADTGLDFDRVDQEARARSPHEDRQRARRRRD